MLSQKEKIKSKDLAEVFEVSERTIFRDINALNQLKIPIISETGGDGGYSLMKDYFLQPVVLTEDECEALFLGCDFISKQEEFPLSKPATRALDKIKSLIPKHKREEAEKITERIYYNVCSYGKNRQANLLKKLKTALDSQRTVIVTYDSLSANEVTTRAVDIYNLSFQNSSWYIQGYCHLRDEMREFKIQRIKDVNITEQVFIIRNNCKNTKLKHEREPISIKVRNNTITCRTVKENDQLNQYINKEDNQWLYLLLPPQDFSENYVLSILLSLGCEGEIEKPEYLRVKFSKLLKDMIKKYEDLIEKD